MENNSAAILENENITHITKQDQNFWIIGTAHVSKESAELVEKVIEELRPDTVCVELCEARYNSIKNQKKFEDTDIVQIIKDKKAYLLLTNLILSSFQKKIADKMEVKPGQEMIMAMEKSQETGAETVLADRNLQTTLSRAWASMSFFEKVKVVVQLIFAAGSDEEISQEEIERLKQTDVLETLLDEIGKTHPELKNVLITERDKYLCEKIKSAPGNDVVAVVGAGHVPGIKKFWNHELDIQELETNPEPGKALKIIKWLIPGIIVAMIASGFFMGGKTTGSDMVVTWFIFNAVMAGLGAAVSLAHPLTILTAAVAAPFTSINPMVAAGWIAGIAEAMLRKPKVRDLSNLSEDITTIKGFWKNNVTRILLVVVFTNLGSAIGTFAAFPALIKILG